MHPSPHDYMRALDARLPSAEQCYVEVMADEMKRDRKTLSEICDELRHPRAPTKPIAFGEDDEAFGEAFEELRKRLRQD